MKRKICVVTGSRAVLDHFDGSIFVPGVEAPDAGVGAEPGTRWPGPSCERRRIEMSDEQGPPAFAHRTVAREEDIDDLGHVNNLHYLRWMLEQDFVDDTKTVVRTALRQV